MKRVWKWKGFPVSLAGALFLSLPSRIFHPRPALRHAAGIASSAPRFRRFAVLHIWALNNLSTRHGFMIYGASFITLHSSRSVPLVHHRRFSLRPPCGSGPARPAPFTDLKWGDRVARPSPPSFPETFPELFAWKMPDRKSVAEEAISSGVEFDFFFTLGFLKLRSKFPRTSRGCHFIINNTCDSRQRRILPGKTLNFPVGRDKKLQFTRHCHK